jgi:hypothetical protein
VQVRATAVDACKRLGRYRMPFCWTAIELAKIFRGIPLTGKQHCCGSGSASFWESGSASNTNQDPDPLQDLHQIKIRIRIWIRIRLNFQIKSQNAWNTSLFEHFFKSLSPYLEAGIQIRVKVGSGSASNKNLDPHQVKIR